MYRSADKDSCQAETGSRRRSLSRPSRLLDWYYAGSIAALFFLMAHDARPARYFMVEVSSPLQMIHQLKQPLLALLLGGGILLSPRRCLPRAGIPRALMVVLVLLQVSILVGYLETVSFGAIVFKPALSLAFFLYCTAWVNYDGGVRLVQRSVTACYLLAIALLAAALLQWVLDPQALVKAPEFRLLSGRLYGTTSNCNVLALALVPVAGAAAHSARHEVGGLRTLVHVALLVLVLTLLVWTGSRTAIVVGLATVLILFDKPIWRFATLALAGLIAAAYGAELTAATGRDWVVDSRSVAWLRLIEMIREHPISGVGVGHGVVTQNSYLGAWAIYGVGAFALTCAAALLVAAAAWMLMNQRAAFQTPVGQGAIAAMAGGLLVTATENIWLGTLSTTLGCILLGITAATERRELAVSSDSGVHW